MSKEELKDLIVENLLTDKDLEDIIQALKLKKLVEEETKKNCDCGEDADCCLCYSKDILQSLLDRSKE